MQSLRATGPLPPRRSVAIDLIGDLDDTLGAAFDEMLERIAGDGIGVVSISTRHVTRTTTDGLERLDGALVRARAGGCSVSVEAGNRRMRAAFAVARIACDRSGEPRPQSDRHVMIARHAVDRIAATSRS